MSHISAQDYRCPQCGQVDRVEKVSVLFEEKNTPIAEKLAPPSMPHINGNALGCISIIILFLLFYVFLLGPFLQGNFPVVNVLVFLVIASAFGAWNIKAASARRAKLAVAMSRWESIISKWNRLYYCYRNDVIFIPGEPESCLPASQMSMLISSNIVENIS